MSAINLCFKSKYERASASEMDSCERAGCGAEDEPETGRPGSASQLNRPSQGSGSSGHKNNNKDNERGNSNWRGPSGGSITVTRLIVYLIVVFLQPPASSAGAKMVRLCIASIDPAKLSSQCVMCNRREFPLTVIDCTGITKVNDLIANPLSVQEATCLIYNCRRVSRFMGRPHWPWSEPTMTATGRNDRCSARLYHNFELERAGRLHES